MRQIPYLIFCLTLTSCAQLKQRTMPENTSTSITYSYQKSMMNGLSAADDGNWDSALLWFTRALAVRPKDSVGLSERAKVFVHLGQIDAARNDLEVAITQTKHPDLLGSLLAQLGMLHLRSGRALDALSTFERSLGQRADSEIYRTVERLKRLKTLMAVPLQPQAEDRAGHQNMATYSGDRAALNENWEPVDFPLRNLDKWSISASDWFEAYDTFVINVPIETALELKKGDQAFSIGLCTRGTVGTGMVHLGSVDKFVDSRKTGALFRLEFSNGFADPTLEGTDVSSWSDIIVCGVGPSRIPSCIKLSQTSETESENDGDSDQQGTNRTERWKRTIKFYPNGLTEIGDWRVKRCKNKVCNSDVRSRSKDTSPSGFYRLTFP